MRYVLARLEKEEREQAYRFYVTKGLQLVPQNKWITMDYMELLNPQAVEKPKSGDEIALDIISRAGLKFGE